MPTIGQLLTDWVIKPISGIAAPIYAIRLTDLAHDPRVEVGTLVSVLRSGLVAMRWSTVRLLAYGWLW